MEITRDALRTLAGRTGVDDGRLVVVVVDLGHRREIYRDL